MTTPSFRLLRLEPDIPDELRLALGQEPSELPSDEAVGALRARLADQVGPARRLRDRAALGAEPLQQALRDDPSEFPSEEQLRDLMRRVELERNAARPAGGARAARRMRPAVLAACLLIASAAAAAAASYWLSRDREQSAPPPLLSSSVLGGRPILREPAAEPSPRPGPTPITTAEAHAGARSTPDRPRASSSLAAQGPTELQLLREAQRLQARDPAAALAVVARHQRLFPSGVLAQERELVAIDALTRLGRSEAARARAATFLRQYPGSVHAVRIRELVGGPAPSSSVGAVAPGAASAKGR